MKKFLLLVAGVLCLASCSTEQDSTTNELMDTRDESLEYQLEDKGFFKGVFTTKDAEYRATIEINVPKAPVSYIDLNNELPTAKLTLHTGEVYEIQADESAYFGTQISGLTFSSEEFSFKLSVGEDGNNVVVSDVVFKNSPGDVVAARHTEKSPVTTITGTWECVECNDHPVVGQGNVQTFNMLFANPAGNGTVTTQSTIASSTTTGVGVRELCTLICTQSVTQKCAINSGDGLTNVGFNVNGKPVTWTGTHVFADDPTCTLVEGEWEWESISYGVLTGTFTSDNSVFCCED